VAASAVVEAPPPPATAAAAVARHRVLIIDDELPLARLFARALRGHEVTTLSSAAEALPGIRAGGYDCVVCDLMIPGFGGLDLHAALVADGQGHDRRLVFVTGGAFVAEAERLLGMVTQPVLLKPFPARVLADAVATLLATVSPAVGPR
jgi:CheY-like chemotaxis protein